MTTFCYVITLLAACVAAMILGGGVMGAKGAPQEAASGAVAAAVVVIPYVFTRCVEKISGNRELREIADLLRRDRKDQHA